MPPPTFPPDANTLSSEDASYIAAAQRRLGSGSGSESSGTGTGRGSATATESVGGATTGLSLDPQALAALSSHFEALLKGISERVESLSAQTLRSTQASHRRAGGVVDAATVEIESLRDVLRQCEELQNEFLKIRRIGEIVKGFRARVDALERRIGK